MDEDLNSIGKEVGDAAQFKFARPGSGLDLTILSQATKHLGLSPISVEYQEEVKNLHAYDLKVRLTARKKIKTLNEQIAKIQKARIAEANLVASTCIGAFYRFDTLAEQNFDYVIFDEASQIPLALTLA